MSVCSGMVLAILAHLCGTIAIASVSGMEDIGHANCKHRRQPPEEL